MIYLKKSIHPVSMTTLREHDIFNFLDDSEKDIFLVTEVIQTTFSIYYKANNLLTNTRYTIILNSRESGVKVVNTYLDTRHIDGILINTFSHEYKDDCEEKN